MDARFENYNTTFHATRAIVRVAHFPSWHQYTLRDRQFAHSPTLPKSEAVAPRCSWDKETTAQSPTRCSDVLPRIPRRMFSHEHQPTDRKPASTDPTRVLTESESDIWEDKTTRLLRGVSVRALAAEREGETLGKLRIRPSQVHPAVPGKARHSTPYLMASVSHRMIFQSEFNQGMVQIQLFCNALDHTH